MENLPLEYNPAGAIGSSVCQCSYFGSILSCFSLCVCSLQKEKRDRHRRQTFELSFFLEKCVFFCQATGGGVGAEKGERDREGKSFPEPQSHHPLHHHLSLVKSLTSPSLICKLGIRRAPPLQGYREKSVSNYNKW